MTDSAVYNPKIFDATDIEQAKKIILTPEFGNTTDDRWQKETPYLLELFDKLNITRDSVVLDFGCGIGRNAKSMIDKYNCSVVGTDISANMRALSYVYTPDKRFCSMDNILVEKLGLQFDAAISVWALQHAYPIAAHVEFIYRSLKRGGKLFVANERVAVIPTDKGWMNDHTDIFMLLQQAFKTEVINVLDPAIVTEQHSKLSFYGIFEKV